MRILFFSTTFPDSSSPTRGTYNAALVRALHAQNHQVSVISPRFFNEVYSFGSIKKKQFTRTINIARLGIQVQYPTYWYTPRILQTWYGEQMWWSVRKCVEKTVEAFRPDAVLSYWAHPDGEGGLRAAKLAEVPSAVIVGGSDVLVLPHHAGRGHKVREVLKNSGAVITVSEGLRKKVCELNIPELNVVTIYQGVEEKLFECNQTRQSARVKLGLSQSQTHLLWVGRMVEVKALPVLLDAAALLRNRGFSFQLHLLGDGPQRQQMEQLASQLGLESHVKFHGPIAHDSTPDWYRAADLTVLCSDSEGLPNVLRESLACGTPFVSTDVGSIQEIAIPEATRLVPPQNPAALAVGIQEMITPNAQMAASNYLPTTWSNTARKTARLLLSLRGHRVEESTTEVMRLEAAAAAEVGNGELQCFSPVTEENSTK